MTKLTLNGRTLLAMTHDFVACIVAWPLAFLLRFNLDIPETHAAVPLHSLPWVVPVQAAIFIYFGLYRGIWRHASLPDLKRIALAVLAAAVAVPAVLFFARVPDVPRSVLVLNPLLLIMIMGASRILYRIWRERRLRVLSGEEAKPVLLIGAGDAASDLLREFARSSKWKCLPPRIRLVAAPWTCVRPQDSRCARFLPIRIW